MQRTLNVLLTLFSILNPFRIRTYSGNQDWTLRQILSSNVPKRKVKKVSITPLHRVRKSPRTSMSIELPKTTNGDATAPDGGLTLEINLVRLSILLLLSLAALLLPTQSHQILQILQYLLLQPVAGP